ncbi:adenine specific DNA methyltransferase domain protein [Helicobacter pylori CPY6271]|nr:adenine specific DNA methyltransferase domain protein [Helicobacter pylori CPY6271]
MSSKKENNLMQRLGNSLGNGAGCFKRFLDSPLKLHSPFV